MGPVQSGPWVVMLSMSWLVPCPVLLCVVVFHHPCQVVLSISPSRCATIPSSHSVGQGVCALPPSPPAQSCVSHSSCSPLHIQTCQGVVSQFPLLLRPWRVCSPTIPPGTVVFGRFSCVVSRSSCSPLQSRPTTGVVSPSSFFCGHGVCALPPTLPAQALKLFWAGLCSVSYCVSCLRDCHQGPGDGGQSVNYAATSAVDEVMKLEDLVCDRQVSMMADTLSNNEDD